MWSRAMSVQVPVRLGGRRGHGRRQDAFRRQLLELGRGFLMPALARDLPAEQGMREQAFGELRRWRHRVPAAFEIERQRCAYEGSRT